MSRIAVTGAGGFIGHHLIKKLKAEGHWVRGIDTKYPKFEDSEADTFEILDMRHLSSGLYATRGVDQVYALAADMGGMGFISENHAEILHNNMLIDIHTLETARRNAMVRRYFYASSACVYPVTLQDDVGNLRPLREIDAYPAEPQDAYGWEKLTAEQLCQHYNEEYPIETRIARFHNVYGPYGEYEGGREKVPAALCRKIAIAKLTDNPEIEIWGDGEQTRSFCYVSDCVEWIYRLMQSDYPHPLNIGRDQMVSINELADIIASVANVKIVKRHIQGPQGVRARNSDNTKLHEVLDYKPQVGLAEGLAITYNWIESEVAKNLC